MRSLVFVLLLIASAMIGCSECTDCTPFTEEPFVNVRFYDQADSSERIIIIDSVNQVSARDLRHFNDTTNSFKFSLNMQEDYSNFSLVLRDTANLATYISHQITFRYDREFVNREDNYVIVACNLTEIIADFAEYNLICKEDEDKCISNEAKANIYY